MFQLKNLEELKKYFILSEDLLAFVTSMTVQTADGRYEFANDCYVNVIRTDTKTESGDMEAHERYVDVQYVLEGEERILLADRDALTVTVSFNLEKDVTFYSFHPTDEAISHAGEGVVIYPNDAHLPERAVTHPKTIKKAVIKIPYCQAIR